VAAIRSCVTRRLQEGATRGYGFPVGVLVVLSIGGASAHAQAQPVASGAAPHVAAAEAAVGQDAVARVLFERLCVAPPPVRPQWSGPQPAARPPAAPPRAEWYAEPVKGFDNLDFVGRTEYTALTVTTSEGIIVIDPLFEYSVADEVPKATRDMVEADGQTLTLGDTTLTFCWTPGHTLGTISTIIPLKVGGRSHVAALWGGTGFNWQRGSPRYITPEHPADFWCEIYSNSARRLRDIAATASADVILSNHPRYDASDVNLPAMRTRKAGEPHPYVKRPIHARRALGLSHLRSDACLGAR